MKILCSPTSPYSAKVRMAARHLGFKVMEINVDTTAAPPELIDNNPLGKIPVLVPGKGKGRGKAIFDSRAIMQYLNRKSEGRLYPDRNGRRTEAEVLEALADGICDCLLAIIYEKRVRPAEMQYEPWMERQWEKALRGLVQLEQHPPKVGKRLHGGHFALAALLGYLALRFEGKWETGHPQLVAWATDFSRHFPAYGAMKSQV
nr:glutathione S-transferase family protein [uncultured Gellertiella sp.]